MNLSSIQLSELVDLQSTARRVTDGREISRDLSHFKLANAIMHEEGGKGRHCEDWRETLLMNTHRTDQPSEESLQS